MNDYKKSMFGFGANSCVNPMKGGGNPCEGCPGKPVGILVVVRVAPRPVGRN